MSDTGDGSKDKRRTAIFVAAISAFALIIAAIITARCSGGAEVEPIAISEPEVEPIEISKQELVELLRARGTEAIRQLAEREAEMFYHASLGADSLEVLRLLTQTRERFRSLHERHVEAIENDQLVIAHEILIEIHYLLMVPDHIREAQGGPAGEYVTDYPMTMWSFNDIYTGVGQLEIKYSPWEGGLVVPEEDYLQEWADNRLRLDSLVADLAAEYREVLQKRSQTPF